MLSSLNMRPVGATSFKACHQSIAFQHPPSSRVRICRSFQSSPAGHLSGYNTSAISSMTDSSSSSSAVSLTCKRCKQQFSPEENHHSACRFHPAIYSGGEVAKALGFVRKSSAPEDQLGAVMGRTGLMRFWDCCGVEDEQAPGCEAGFHLSFDSDVNEKNGWRE